MRLIDPGMRILVQGITGKQGRAATAEMLKAGMNVVCGVTPGKGGQQVGGLPVYDTVAEAPGADASVIIVPPLMVLDAALEAMASSITTILIFTENVPIRDSAIILEHAERAGCVVIGPSSVGVISPGTAKLGAIGGPSYAKGNVGIISKSGGMCSETARLLTTAGIGQSTVIGIGGDVIACTTFEDLLPYFEEDPETEALVLICEIGGVYEERVAAAVAAGKFTKPVVAFVMGRFAESLTQGFAFGHAGAIVENGQGTTGSKRQALEAAGVTVVRYHDDIPQAVKQALSRRKVRLTEVEG